MEIFTFHIDSNKPIYSQIYQTLVDNMMNGYIVTGDKLPSIRDLAKQLNVSKSTVENAYDRLLSEGYIISKAKSGYFCDIPDLKKQQKKEMTYSHTKKQSTYLYDFSSRSSDYSQFDQKVWIRYTKEVLENGTLMSGYGDPQGEFSLRQQLSSYLYTTRGLHAKAENLLIGAGISPLLYFICSLFKDQTLHIGFLKPGFVQAMSVFEDCHHKIILLDSLEDLKTIDLDLLYITPTSLNLNMKHRMALLQTLKEKHIYLIEDDLNGEMHYKSTPISCMQGLYDEEMVFYLSSFSKLLLPSVRIAVLSIPQNFNYSLHYYNQTASRIEQQVLAMYLQDGHMQRRIKRLKRLYVKKSSMMYDLLTPHFSNIQLVEPNLCFEISGDFTHLYPDEKINFQKISNQKLRLYFSGISEDKIDEGILYFITKWKS